MQKPSVIFYMIVGQHATWNLGLALNQVKLPPHFFNFQCSLVNPLQSQYINDNSG